MPLTVGRALCRCARLLAALTALGSGARADEPRPATDLRPAGEPILTAPPAFTIESARFRFTHYDQDGRGYQSQAGPPVGPGSEAVTVEQPQLEVVAKQGERLTHRIWVPLDVVTAASPDAIDGTWNGKQVVDTISGPSRLVHSGALDLLSSYRLDRVTNLFVRGAFHIEEPFRSWSLGGGFTRALADDNAVVSASINQVVDWFDTFDIYGVRLGHAERSTTNVNVGLTQLLSATTVANVNYGGTVQIGQLGNTWNSVPLSDGTRGAEQLPTVRQRHALVGRLAQALPWRAAVHLFYRFYVDDWGLVGNTGEVELYQRVARWGYLRANYRVHHQTGVDFFTRSAPVASSAHRTADSDLAPFVAQTFGVLAAVDLRFARRVRDLHLDVGYERYFRSNDLRVNVYTCAIGFRF